MARSRYRIYETEYPYFLTCTIVNWLPIFSSPSIAKIILDSWQFLQDQQRLTIHGYVILENHLHLVAKAKDLSKEIGDFKSFTARQIIDYLIDKNAKHVLDALNYYKLHHKTDRQYQLWQEGSHPEQINSLTIMQQKIEYIHQNPVKRGYVDEAIHWRYSSARNYAGLEGLLQIEKYSL
jgi:REP element-mobilizing transposase RayT